jgi:hypothetical protein
LRTGNNLSAEKTDEIAAKLMLVATKAESKVRYGDQTFSPEELKRSLAAGNKQLLSYFDGLSLEFHIEGKHVVALICNGRGQFMIAEDSACTAEVDRKDHTHSFPCSFSLNLSEICANK